MHLIDILNMNIHRFTPHCSFIRIINIFLHVLIGIYTYFNFQENKTLHYFSHRFLFKHVAFLGYRHAFKSQWIRVDDSFKLSILCLLSFVKGILAIIF